MSEPESLAIAWTRGSEAGSGGYNGRDPTFVWSQSLENERRHRNAGHCMSRRKKPEELRSHRWFGASDMRQFGHHSRAAQMGYSRRDYLGKPIIAIINTWSDINACHSHFRQRAEEVKRWPNRGKRGQDST